MKTTKPQAILLMYEILMKEGRLEKNDILSRCLISETTFKRYISEIRCYLMNYHDYAELHYDKRNDYYVLVK
jgi:hypothetical protein